VLAADGALPDYQSSPSSRSQVGKISFVVVTIVGDLLSPKDRVGSGPMEEFTFVTMPKAAVHEDDGPVLGEY
jgi:hypothetical protein